MGHDMTVKPNCWYSSDYLYLYSGGARFESRPGHRCHDYRFSRLSLVLPSKFRDNVSIWPQPLPSISFLIQRSNLYNLDTDYLNMRRLCLTLVLFVKYVHVLFGTSGDSVHLDVVLDMCVLSPSHTLTLHVSNRRSRHLTSRNRKKTINQKIQYKKETFLNNI
jgi:hypothetical protein